MINTTNEKVYFSKGKVHRLFWCEGNVQTVVLSGNHKTIPVALVSLLGQAKEAPMNKDCQNTKRTNVKAERGDREELYRNIVAVPLCCSVKV